MLHAYIESEWHFCISSVCGPVQAVLRSISMQEVYSAQARACFTGKAQAQAHGRTITLKHQQQQTKNSVQCIHVRAALTTTKITVLECGFWWWWVLIIRCPALSPFLIGRMFLREPSWKYSLKLHLGPKSFAQHVLGTFALLDDHCL